MSKPKSPRQWNSTVKVRSKPLPRGGRPKARNAKRRITEFARCCHSKARVRWVKSLGCIYCTAISPLFGIATAGRSDNAHTENDGAGRKGHYTTIVPLDRTHHRMYDEHRGPFAEPAVRAAIRDAAAEVERRWLAHVARVSGGAGGTPE